VRRGLAKALSEKDPRAGGFCLTEDGKSVLQGFMT